MVYKRPFGDEESCELACKHPRQLEYSNQLASFADITSYNDMPQNPLSLVGESDCSKGQCDERLESGTITELSIGAGKDLEITAPVGISSLSWATSSTSEEDSRSEATDRVPFFPGYYEPDYPATVLAQSEEIYSSPLDYHPRKLVAVGPDHQANVPAWGFQDTHCFGAEVMVPETTDDKLMGTCIIPMPDLEQSVYSSDNFGCGRTICSCPDGGSIRCVKQHIMETREKLRETLGQEKFAELGFCDMGEEVARNWNEEEEQSFHEVVFSNPASLGKNFWDHLSVVFPSRTKSELVSYYFNVFMLRRRAEQNRVDPMNIDSDNDEWHGNYDGDEEFGMTEEDEDSVVESPVGQDDPSYNQEVPEEDFHEDDEDGDEICEHNDDSDLENDRDATGEEDEVSEACIGKSFGDCSFDDAANLVSTNPQLGRVDHDVQDDSCTSYECQTNAVSSCGPVDPAGAVLQGSRLERGNGKHLESTLPWGDGYVIGPKKDVELLPMCNMIEEEAWNNKERDDKRIS
ncbi:PREDICTED: uncharacterized protein LOC104597984 [Nelumbo nucifera]|uniref:Uncharacterized protein LOC104597984 n=1 Tax=Nelumbo nucifera TaxID=4432 RepID=A0A1U7ZUP9_NELNU|nr:PREDICTED: uncharacterized protein LOC104597984 [Nelumbo nucifera]